MVSKRKKIFILTVRLKMDLDFVAISIILNFPVLFYFPICFTSFCITMYCSLWPKKDLNEYIFICVFLCFPLTIDLKQKNKLMIILNILLSSHNAIGKRRTLDFIHSLEWLKLKFNNSNKNKWLFTKKMSLKKIQQPILSHIWRDNYQTSPKLWNNSITSDSTSFCKNLQWYIP